jgi:hypothetical protein
LPNLPNLKYLIDKVSALTNQDKRGGILLSELMKQTPLVYKHNFEPIDFGNNDVSWEMTGCFIGTALWLIVLTLIVIWLGWKMKTVQLIHQQPNHPNLQFCHLMLRLI